MDIKKLFSGIAVIIDNEVYQEDSPIFRIRKAITNSNIPVVTYKDIPPVEIVESLGNASFVIMDWNFFDEPVVISEEERIGLMNQTELQKEKQEEVIDFIKMLLDKLFVPIFVFSGVDISEVEEILSEKGIYEKGKANRVFVKSKTEIETQEELFHCIEDWMTQMPSIYAMKEWDRVIQTTKNLMFNEWYQYSPRWVSVIWKMLEEDSSEEQDEFGRFLTRNLANRIPSFHFEKELFSLDGDVDKDELERLLEKERYIEYGEEVPSCANTGDLFKDGENYYLNIRAQCDLARKKDKVDLYLIRGKALDISEIVTEDIQLSSDGKLCFPDKNYSLKELLEMCETGTEDNEECISELKEINDRLKKYRNLTFFGRGEIIEKKTEVILPCVDNGKVIRFRLDLKVEEYKKWKEKRIGRVLPPYITRIQQKCSQYIIREGTMPIPREMLNVIPKGEEGLFEKFFE